MLLFNDVRMVYGCLLFIVGHVFGWFAGNSQFVWDYWQDKPILATILFGIPAGLAFWYGTRFCFEATGELWSVRFTAAVFSYFTFPILTWYYMHESMFTLKTMLCVFLAFLILIIQMFFD